VSLLLDSSRRGQTRAGNSRTSLSNNAVQHQQQQQQQQHQQQHPQQHLLLNPQLAQKESQDWTMRGPVEMDGNIHRPVGSNQSPTLVPRTLSPTVHKSLLDQSDMASRGTNIRLPSATEETKPVGSTCRNWRSIKKI